jgi:hypothetical protein
VSRAATASSILRVNLEPCHFICNRLPSPKRGYPARFIAFPINYFPVPLRFLVFPSGVIHVLTAVITAQGELTKTMPYNEKQAAPSVPCPGAHQNAQHRATKASCLRPGKPKSGKKATHAQKRASKPKGANPAKAARRRPRGQQERATKTPPPGSPGLGSPRIRANT